MYQIVCKFIRFCTKQAIHLKKEDHLDLLYSCLSFKDRLSEAGKLDSKRQITISSYEELQDYMYLAVLADASAKNIDRALSDSSKSSVAQLKYRIFNAYLRATDDFRQSIFER